MAEASHLSARVLAIALLSSAALAVDA